MAVIPNTKLAKHSQVMSRGNVVDYGKSDLYSAIQAVVDLLQSPSSRTAVNNAIEGAAPSVFSVAQKEKIFVRAVDELFEQENV